MNAILIGRLLRANTGGCVVGCQVSNLSAPGFGALVRIPIPLEGNSDAQVYGLIYDIHIDDDGLVRQLVTAERVEESVILDNRNNRNVPLEISVLFVGYQEGQQIFHLLPPRPPLTLDSIYLCSTEELFNFTTAGRFGYLRHILRSKDLPVSELLAAHVRLTGQAQMQMGNPAWVSQCVQEVITLLRDDYAALMQVLSALADTRVQFPLNS